MKFRYIHAKLAELNYLDKFHLGDYDQIGELTARKQRDPSDINYKKSGAFFRPNYERGILVTALIHSLGLTSMLEIGFGRGYVSLCAAKAFCDAGRPGCRVVTIDPQLDTKHHQILANVYPPSWFDLIEFKQGQSSQILPQLENERFDLIYIDGDHTAEAVQSDWDNVKDRFNKCVLFDDYHMPSKDSGPGIQVAQVVDKIDFDSISCEAELLIMDRRLFVDDRKMADEQIDYGMCLVTRKT